MANRGEVQLDEPVVDLLPLVSESEAGMDGKSRFAIWLRIIFHIAVNAQLTFEPDREGRATRLVLHQNGTDQIAERI